MVNKTQPSSHGQPDVFDMVVVGAGPAGLFGTFYAGMRGMRTALIDALPQLGGQLAVLYPEKYIYDVPGFPRILAKDLVCNLVEQALQFSPVVRLGERVLGLELVDNDGAAADAHQPRMIELSTSCCTYRTRSVLIAAGMGAFAPNRVDVPGVAEFEHNIYYFVQDLSVFADKRVLIVGGGDSAVDWALHLHDIAQHVTLIHRRDQFRAHESTVNELNASPVDVRLFHELKSLHGNGNLERAIIFHNKSGETTELPVDAVLLSLGFKADLGPINEWGLDIDRRAITVGCDQATSLPGVYAAGDIAGTPVKMELITVGFAQATIAVNSAKAYIDPGAKVFPGHSSNVK